jgi:hypothetical protein
MTHEQQKQHFEGFVHRMRNIQLQKGNDYANEDRLSNFKLAGAIAGVSAEINCLNQIATKVARLGVLLHNQLAPNNESIRDSVIDLANYAMLLDMIIQDNASIPTDQFGISAESHQMD